MATIHITSEIENLIDRGALFVVNHSGGKDSQIMHIGLTQVIPKNQLVAIHAELPGVDWPGIIEHINSTRRGVPLITCKAIKTFMDMVRHRQMWPSPKNRQCTSDLKRGPIEKTIRHEIKRRGHSGLIVNCVGIRAQESASRKKADPWKFSARNSRAGREWYEWLPIHHYLEEDVFNGIFEANEKPHWAYLSGMSRLSCCFCIMASKRDLAVAARLAPALYAEYVQMERTIDQTMMMPTKKGRVFLEEYTGIKCPDAT